MSSVGWHHAVVAGQVENLVPKRSHGPELHMRGTSKVQIYVGPMTGRAQLPRDISGAGKQ